MKIAVHLLDEYGGLARVMSIELSPFSSFSQVKAAVGLRQGVCVFQDKSFQDCDCLVTAGVTGSHNPILVLPPAFFDSQRNRSLESREESSQKELIERATLELVETRASRQEQQQILACLEVSSRSALAQIQSQIQQEKRLLQEEQEKARRIELSREAEAIKSRVLLQELKDQVAAVKEQRVGEERGSHEQRKRFAEEIKRTLSLLPTAIYEQAIPSKN